jgi:hypothetical protein
MRRTIPIIIMVVLFIALFAVKRCLYREIIVKKKAAPLSPAFTAETASPRAGR